MDVEKSFDMKQIPILSGRCLVVELPEGATNPEIHSRSLTFDTPLEVDEWGYDYQAVKLPEGNWHIVGMLSEVTEEQLTDIVKPVRHRNGAAMFYNYDKRIYTPFIRNRVESLHSSIMSEGWNISLLNSLGDVSTIDYPEEWKDIVDYEGLYKVSSHGRVKNKRGNLLKIRPIGRKPYVPSLCVRLSKSGKSKSWLIHRLLGLHFLSPPDNADEMDINHLDGNRLNNCLRNLEWSTKSSNLMHAFRFGLNPTHGERGSKSILKESDVREIFSLYSKGNTPTEIAKMYGVGRSTVSKIVNGNNWTHLKREKSRVLDRSSRCLLLGRDDEN